MVTPQGGRTFSQLFPAQMVFHFLQVVLDQPSASTATEATIIAKGNSSGTPAANHPTPLHLSPSSTSTLDPLAIRFFKSSGSPYCRICIQSCTSCFHTTHAIPPRKWRQSTRYQIPSSGGGKKIVSNLRIDRREGFTWNDFGSLEQGGTLPPDGTTGETPSRPSSNAGGHNTSRNTGLPSSWTPAMFR